MIQTTHLDIYYTTVGCISLLIEDSSFFKNRLSLRYCLYSETSKLDSRAYQLIYQGIRSFYLRFNVYTKTFITRWVYHVVGCISSLTVEVSKSLKVRNSEQC